MHGTLTWIDGIEADYLLAGDVDQTVGKLSSTPRLARGELVAELHRNLAYPERRAARVLPV
jgi:hypothetical protein